jgi:hypothetical protein
MSELYIMGVPTLPTMLLKWGSFIVESNELSVLDILAFHNLRGIEYLTIENCPNLVSLSSQAFSHFTALQYLRIHKCPKLTRSNITSEVFQENSTSASKLVLPSLKLFSIASCGVTGSWLSQMLSHSHFLERLILTDCPEIKFISVSQPTLTEGTSSSVSATMTSARNEHHLIIPCNILCSLKELSINSCLDLEFCGGKGDFGGFTSLVTLRITYCPKLVLSLVAETKDDGTVEVVLLPPSLDYLYITHLPEKFQFPEGLLNLKKLTIFDSQNLKSVQLHSCMALEELRISGCEHMAEMDGLQCLTSLRSLFIIMNTKLSCAWDLKLQGQEQGSNQIQLLPPSVDTLEIWKLTDTIQSHLLSCLPALTKLKIHESPDLTSIQLGYCTTLQELEIRDCESLAWIEGFQFIRSLTALTVSNSPSLASCLELVSNQHGASEIWSGLKTLVASDASVLSMPFCKQLTSLTHLQFRNWRSEQRQSMVSLTEEQERALELLSSLQELRFMCSDLLSLPTNLHRLTSLESLCITGCQSIARLPDTGLPPLLSLLSLSGCSEGLGTQCRMAATYKLTVSID